MIPLQGIGVVVYLTVVFVAAVDLQMVQISLRVLFRPDGHNLPFVYRRLGTGNGMQEDVYQ